MSFDFVNLKLLITSRVEILFKKVLAFAQLGGRVTWRLGNLGAGYLWVILSFVTISFFFFFVMGGLETFWAIAGP